MTGKQFIGKIHLWLGLASGLVVFILGITGCLYAFIDEIKPIVYKDRLFIEVPDQPSQLPLSVLRNNAQEALGKEYPLQAAEIPVQADRNISFRTRKFNEHAFGYSNYVDYYYRVYVNPYTGKVVKIENTKWEFFNLIVNIHVNLLLGHDIGGPIIGWSVFIFVITLISGLVLWWPKNKKSAKKRIWFRWKETTKWKRKNYDLHNIFGFYVLLISLVIALTGLVWAFKWFDNSVQWIANGGKTIEKPKPVFSDTTLTNKKSHIDSAIVTTQQKYTDAKSFFVSFPQNTRGTINIFIDYNDVFQTTSVKYDQYSVKIAEVSDFSDKNNGAKIRALNYDIHTGGILYFPGKLLAFFASLISASLPVTGFLIWWERGKKNKKKSNKSKTSNSPKTSKKNYSEEVI